MIPFDESLFCISFSAAESFLLQPQVMGSINSAESFSLKREDKLWHYQAVRPEGPDRLLPGDGEDHRNRGAGSDRRGGAQQELVSDSPRTPIFLLSDLASRTLSLGALVSILN